MSLIIDLNDVKAFANEFPDGPIMARIDVAKLDIAKGSGAPMIVVDFEIYHPDHGTATIRDWIVASFPNKVRNLWIALNNFSTEEYNQFMEESGGHLELTPETLHEAEFIINLGPKEYTDGKTGEKRVGKEISPPWYYPASRVDLLETPPF